MNPLISTIVPLYNGRERILEALRSILEQDYHPQEVFVVDDGSSDGGADLVAERHPSVHLLRQPNAGVAAARNRALALARGVLVAFLDQDDEWLPGKLTAQVRTLIERPDAAYAVCRQRVHLAPGQPRPPWVRELDLREDQYVHLPGAILARRSAFDRVGVYDPSYVNGSDTDWVYRVRDAGLSYAETDGTYLLKRVHAANESHRMDVSRADLFRALQQSIRRRRAP